jgi:hypothetical protein
MVIKNSIYIYILFLFILSCNKDRETDKLESLLHTCKFEIDKYKVICIVPADGCSSCINPSLEYSKIAKKSFLLVLSSLYKKSIYDIIENLHIDTSKVLLDTHNFAGSTWLVYPTAPSYYFLKKGKVVKKIELSIIDDKTSVLKEADLFMSK